MPSVKSQIQTKADIDFHSDGYGHDRGNPAVNVKVYQMDWTDKKIEEEFHCSSQVASKAGEYAFDSAQEEFWRYWTDDDEINNPDYLYFPGYHIEVHSEGRMGGWLVVEGLPPVENWDAIMLNRWRKFVKDVLEDVKYRSSWEAVREGIEVNRWAEEGAERWNYCTTKTGRDICYVDLNQYLAECRRKFIAGEV